MKFVFFKTSKPRRFDHIPIYYDERKERLEKMKRMADSQSDNDSFKASSLKGQLKKEWSKSSISGARQEKRKSNIRVAVIIAVLLMITYFIMKADFAALSGLYD